MGGLLSRSFAHGNGKVRKEKRKRRHEKLEMSFESDSYLIYNGNENEDPNMDFITTYDQWDQEFDQQKIINLNDAPGAPSTYPSNYSVNQNDVMTQSWSSPHDVNNSFYPINSLRMTPPYNIPYIPNQYNQDQVPNTINNQSKTAMLEERPSKKVQFAPSHQEQQQTSTFKPLSNTHSWHESTNMSAPTTTKPAQLSNALSLPRQTAVMLKMSSTQVPVEKPIYVGIDHEATLAERGQTVANKHHRKNGERNHSDGLNLSTNNHQSHAHTNHQHKHRTATDSPRSNNDNILNKSFDSFQPKSSSSQRMMTKSLSTNKSGQNFEQIQFINNEPKPLKSRRQQLSVNNEIRSSKNRENHRRHHHQQQQFSTLSNESSLKTQSLSRRIEIQHPGTPVMRIPLSQLNQKHQKQPLVRSIPTTTANLTRVRV